MLSVNQKLNSKLFVFRYNYTTPKSFLELIYLYKNMLAKERGSLMSDVDRLSTGLDKLEKTAKDVAVLEEEIKVKSVEVEAAKQQADEIAEKVGGEKAKVETAAAGANEEAAKCAVIAEKAGKPSQVPTQSSDCAVSTAPLIKSLLSGVIQTNQGRCKWTARGIWRLPFLLWRRPRLPSILSIKRIWES